MNNESQIKLVLKQCEGINLQKLKVDTLLLVVHSLLNDFDKLDFSDDSNPMLISASKSDITLINKSVESLTNYLDSNIISKDTLVNLYKNPNPSALNSKIKRSLEPMRDYYKYLSAIFSTKIQKGSMWIPELLAFSLLYNYKKEHGKSLNLYPLIDNFPIEKILQIYNKNNLELKKNIANKDNKTTWKVKTDIDEMYDISELMIKKYLNYNFKINPKRVSKTRSKKRR
ncbi:MULTISPECIES: hypothetical protein [Arcobacteraceae]|uniref:Uncharacterized protein n=1 Tax=Poseidonibacter parvus TaxID=1850254 RepID=A0A1P8KJW1_9BACT|nr:MULTISPECIES: hypothetical protein [Arcobacteraceae]APW64837.1 hypothetical protein LPB137_02730 [Poseidonibacter parvus]